MIILYCLYNSFTAPGSPCLYEPGPCDINADCQGEEMSKNFTCECKHPYTVGDGFNCSSELIGCGRGTSVI